MTKDNKYIYLDETNWKEYHGQKCEFSIDGTVWSGLLLLCGFDPLNKVFLSKAANEWDFCRILKPSKYSDEDREIHRKVMSGWGVKTKGSRIIRFIGQYDHKGENLNYDLGGEWCSFDDIRKAELIAPENIPMPGEEG